MRELIMGSEAIPKHELTGAFCVGTNFTYLGYDGVLVRGWFYYKRQQYGYKVYVEGVL